MSNQTEKRYIVFMLTDTAVSEAAPYIEKIQEMFGPQDFDKEFLYAIGFIGPFAITQSVEQMKAHVNGAFDLAEKYNVPIYFQMDDNQNYTDLYGCDGYRYYDDPEMREWTDFPKPGEKYGPSARYWFNWGAWMYRPTSPAFGSPKFRKWMHTQVQQGAAEVIRDRLARLKAEGKEYLFAGIAIGWETQYMDMTPGRPLAFVDPENPPTRDGERVLPEEMRRNGYASLYWNGYDDARLEKEAREQGMSKDDLMTELLYDIQQDYSSELAKIMIDEGLERRKVFTHIISLASIDFTSHSTMIPAIRTAVNPYSTPGFTMSPVTCKYDIQKLKELIHEQDPSQDLFACAEGYAAGLKEDEKVAQAYFDELFGNGAVVITAFGYMADEETLFGGPKDMSNPFNKAICSYLNKK